jgi:hypothetical protein
MMAPHAEIAAITRHLVAAVDDMDVVAVSAVDARVRELVVRVLATADEGKAALLTELALVYRGLVERCEARRDELQQALGEHHRVQAGVAAYAVASSQ